MDCTWIFQFGWDTVYLLCSEGDASSESEDMKSVHTPTRGRILIRSNVAMIGNTVWPFCWHHGFVPLFGLMSTEPRLGKKNYKSKEPILWKIIQTPENLEELSSLIMENPEKLKWWEHPTSWTERISNWSILKEINPDYSLEGLMLKLKLQCFGHLFQRANLLEKDPDAGKDRGQEE